MNDKGRYRVTIHTDEQIVLMEKISECYLRENMGQFWDLAEDLASEGSGYVYDKTDPDNDKKFRAYIKRRDEAEKLFNQAYKAAGGDGYRREKANQAGDFFLTIRHAIWLERPEPKPHDINDAFPSTGWSEEQELHKCFKRDGDWFLEISRIQLKLLQDMSEHFMRERAGQFCLLLDILVHESPGYNMDKDDPDYEENLIKRNRNYEMANVMFEQGYRVSGAAGHPRKTKRMCMAYDFYDTIRHALWLEDPNPDNHLASGDPIHECEEVPLIEVESLGKKRKRGDEPYFSNSC